MSFTFIGNTTPQNLWNNVTINIVDNGVPPDPLGYPYSSGNSTNLRNYNILDDIINWEGTIPASLNGITVNNLSELFGDSNTASINVDYNFIIKTGNQTTACNGRPKINLNMYLAGSGSNQFFSTNVASLSPQCSGICSMSYPYNGQFPNYVFTTNNEVIIGNYDVKAVPWNDNVGCDNYDAGSMTIEAFVKITLTVSCSTPTELNSQFCFDYCSQPNNQQSCYPQYRNYCLVDKDTSGDINIFTNRTCQEFFQDYFANQGPNSETDNDLENACSRKFPTVDEYNQGTTEEQNICACHLPQQIYDNLRNSLINQYPGFQYVPENERCLFPPCPSSDYKTVAIGKVCALPACINIASVTNDGNLKGGVNINQNNACIDVKNGTFNNGGGGGTVEEVKTWIDKYWVWLVIGIAILVVLIIIILVVLAGEGNKKKKVVKEEKI